MTPGTRTALRLAIAVPAALATLLGVVLAVDALRAPARVPSTPVAAPSAIEGWTPPWGAAIPATAASGALPKRWLVVGWDGASWGLILPMLEQGKLPNLAALMRRGSYGGIASFRPTLSPVLWTTVATGVPPERHGILGFDVPKTKVEKRLERLTHWGRLKRRLYNNGDRRVRTVWNLLAERTRPVLVVGYHNTYPAEPVDGLMVSNYLMQDLMSGWMRASGGVDSELAETLVSPVDDLKPVLAIEEEVRASLAEALPAFADLSPEQTDAVLRGQGIDPEKNHRLFFLRQAYLFDTFNAEVAERFLPRIAPDLAMVHFQAIDLASHYFLYFHAPSLFERVALPPGCREELDREAPAFRKTVEAFHEHLDRWLGRLVATAGPDTAVVLLSDHGFSAAPSCHRPGGHEEAPPGILVVAGPGIVAGRRISGATLYDVFPTLAAGLGLPLSRELPGRVLAEVFEAGVLPRDGAVVATYETGARYIPQVAPPAELSEELERQLRSLGYVK